MSDAVSRMADRAADLRQAFDRAFAAPVRPDTAAKEILLGIRIAGQPYAIRLAEVVSVHADKKITRLPGSSAALRGIAGFRGTLLPVYDLHVLLGHSSGETPRWLVVASAAPVALAFAQFEGQLRASPDEILPQSVRPDMPTYAREFARTQNFVGPVLHLPSVLDAIKVLRPIAAPKEE